MLTLHAQGTGARVGGGEAGEGGGDAGALVPLSPPGFIVLLVPFLYLVASFLLSSLTFSS
eukprot:766640-Hanusia_phi.AAC.3